MFIFILNRLTMEVLLSVALNPSHWTCNSTLMQYSRYCGLENSLFNRIGRYCNFSEYGYIVNMSNTYDVSSTTVELSIEGTNGVIIFCMNILISQLQSRERVGDQQGTPQPFSLYLTSNLLARLASSSRSSFFSLQLHIRRELDILQEDKRRVLLSSILQCIEQVSAVILYHSKLHFHINDVCIWISANRDN